jgi:hypothetical protein
MTKDQIFGVVRHVFTAVGGVLIAKGLVTDGSWTELTGAILSLAGVVWSITSKTK